MRNLFIFITFIISAPSFANLEQDIQKLENEYSSIRQTAIEAEKIKVLTKMSFAEENLYSCAFKRTKMILSNSKASGCEAELLFAYRNGLAEKKAKSVVEFA